MASQCDNHTEIASPGLVNEESFEHVQSNIEIDNASTAVLNSSTESLNLQDAISINSTSSIIPYNANNLSLYQLAIVVICMLRFIRSHSPRLRKKYKEKLRLMKKWNQREQRTEKDKEKLDKKLNKLAEQQVLEIDKFHEKEQRRVQKTNEEMENFNNKWNVESKNNPKNKAITYNDPCLQNGNDENTEEQYVSSSIQQSKTVKEDVKSKKKEEPKVLLDIIEEMLTPLIFSPPKTEYQLKMEKEANNQREIDVILAQLLRRLEEQEERKKNAQMKKEWEKDRREKLNEKRQKRKEKHEKEMNRKIEKYERKEKERKEKHENKVTKQIEEYEKKKKKKKERSMKTR